MSSGWSYRAGGNILPMRFVSLVQSSTAQFTVTQSDGTGAIEGISQEGKRAAPGTAADDTFAAISGEPFTVYSDEVQDMPLLESGAAITAGNALIADSVGRGIPAAALTAGTQYQGAVAMENASGSGKFIRVRLIRQTLPKAAA